MSLLSVNNLSVRYDCHSPYILEGINLALRSGDFVLLSGASGCGKSTLVKYLAGLLPDECVSSGALSLDHLALSPLKAAERAHHIGTVLQNADEQIIFERLEDELAFPSENLRRAPADISEWVHRLSEDFNLDLSQKTDKLSGGQKQKLTIASTLSMEQKFIVLDEPLANLDTKTSVHVLAFLRQLCLEQSYAILIVEHRTDLVAAYATRFIRMERGQLSEYDGYAAFEKALHSKSITLNAAVYEKVTVQKEAELLFDVQDLMYSVKRRDIIKHVNYQFYRGEKYLLIGENGSGKSTLLNLLAGVLKPSSGVISSPFPRKNRLKHIGFVMQNPNYQLFMSSVRAELAYQAKDEDFLAQLIDIFDLKLLLERHPQSLSEGQKRRLGVACILSMEPDVLFLDEPSVGQDLRNMQMMLKAITLLAKRVHLTMITISHDQRCDSFLGNIVLKMDQGELHALN